MKDLCIFAQLHNDSITPEILDIISDIYKSIQDFDIFITIIDEKSEDLIKNHIKNEKWAENIKNIELFNNRGMDIGAFLWQIEKLNIKKDDYLCLLKLHTKTDKTWRDDMLRPFKQNIDKYIKNFRNNEKLGMIGSHNRLCNFEFDEIVITRSIEFAVLNRLTTIEERKFIAGSVFMIRFNVIVDLLKEKNIDEFIKICYTEMPIGRCEHNVPHSFERFLCYYTNTKKLKIVGI
jgi:hypothetical protein